MTTTATAAPTYARSLRALYFVRFAVAIVWVGIVFATTPPGAFTVVGISTSDRENLAGATLAEFDMPVAQQVLDRVGTYNGINVSTVDGVEQPRRFRGGGCHVPLR
jgi:hypothetical protein